MPRHPRVHASGLLSHVMARGNTGQKIFPQAKDYKLFLEQLRGVVRRRYPFYLYAYVLMPNHLKKLAAPKRQRGATRPAKLEVLVKAKAREAGLERQAVGRWGKSRTMCEVRRGFIAAGVLERGYQVSEVASFLGCHASNVGRALQKRRSKI